MASILVSLNSDQGLPGGKSHDFTVQINGGIETDHEKNGWCIGLYSAYIWNSVANISSAYNNNILRYSNDSGESFEANIVFPDGTYSLQMIQSFISTILLERAEYVSGNEPPIKLIGNTATLRAELILASGFQVDFQTYQGLGQMLGFNPDVVTLSGPGQNLVNITNSISSLNINCNLVSGSYNGGTLGNTIFSYSPNVPPGAQIQLRPNNVIYLPVNTKLVQNIRVWITDQSGNPVDLRGEKTSYILEFKRLKPPA